jgi:hypothetical protein
MKEFYNKKETQWSLCVLQACYKVVNQEHCCKDGVMIQEMVLLLLATVLRDQLLII